MKFGTDLQYEMLLLPNRQKCNKASQNSSALKNDARDRVDIGGRDGDMQSLFPRASREG